MGQTSRFPGAAIINVRFSQIDFENLEGLRIKPKILSGYNKSLQRFSHLNLSHFLVFGMLLFTFFFPVQNYAQIRAGSGYLKMLHGAREVGTVGTLTGALDHTYSFYANPAATGFLREWQWSATYTNWISDIYNASFLYGKNIRTPWSRWSRFAVGVNYLGIPGFKNADTEAGLVSGSNLLATASVGQPLTFLSRYLSVGASIKYFNSELAGFEASKFIYDVGLLYRSPRFSFLIPDNSLFDYMILSAGVSANNLGSAIRFVSEDTPLPRVLRGGVAVNLGRHDGFQMSLGTDYRKVRDEDGYFTLGSEFSWRQLISVRMGYTFEDNLLGHFSFGGGLRFDDLLFQNNLVGRNNALRLDLATNQNNDYFSAPYHGSVTHQPIGPEYFRLKSPAYAQQIDADSVHLTWEFTEDPDLYDSVTYYFLLDRDSTKLVKFIDLAGQFSDSALTLIYEKDFQVVQPVFENHQWVRDLRSGDYFWAILAHDKDHHVRFGEMKNQPLGKFHITAPDPRVIAIDFDYSPWITQDAYQGKLNMKIKNVGDRTAENFTITVFDSLFANTDSTKLTYKNLIPELAPNEETGIQLDWNTFSRGKHSIFTKIFKTDKPAQITNQYTDSFFTIPKGVFATEDTVILQKRSFIIYDIPYVGKVYFDSSQSAVNPKFIDNWVIEPPLDLLATRLKNNPSVKIQLQGTIDPNSAENSVALADARAAAVRDSLQALGVASSQMEIVKGERLDPRRLPRNPDDTRWVLEERRRVDITTKPDDEIKLFDPLKTTFINNDNSPVDFHSEIMGVVPIKSGQLNLKNPKKNDTQNLNSIFSEGNLQGDFKWHFETLNESEQVNWLDTTATYWIGLTDSLGRNFKSYPHESVFKSEIVGRERRYYVLAQFETTAPFYDFYWTGLLDIVPFLLENKMTRMQFVGHGCATGSDAINERLSKQRANDFEKKFLEDVGKRYPHLSDEIKQRLDPPKGYGEKVPFRIKDQSGNEILIGDNQTPLGRQLNRRVMVLIYTKKSNSGIAEK